MTRAPSGHRCGADHQNAILSDEVVKAIRAEYKPYVYGYGKIARARDIPVSTVRDICTMRTRVNCL